jgi:hypothetical protein
MTGSPSWTESASDDKAAGVAEMRAAKDESDKGLREDYPHRDPDGLKSEGRKQSLFGKTIGCAGMEERGGEKVQTGERLKTDSS